MVELLSKKIPEIEGEPQLDLFRYNYPKIIPYENSQKFLGKVVETISLVLSYTINRVKTIL